MKTKRTSSRRARWLARLALPVFLVGGALSAGFRPPVTAASQSFGGLTLTEVAPRVVTPNGDSLNDVVLFRFDDTLAGLPVESAILDIHGAKVGSMTLANNDTWLVWNGKDESGRALPAGIYIYSIKIGQKRATGTVVVAR